MKCEWLEENDVGHRVTEPCPEPAAFLSCVPWVDALTCEAHKCRCARPIAPGSLVPPAPDASPREKLEKLREARDRLDAMPLSTLGLPMALAVLAGVRARDIVREGLDAMISKLEKELAGS